MKAQLISDIHSEFYYGWVWNLLDKLPIVENLDFLLLPGDLVSIAYQYEAECRQVFDFFASKAKHVLVTMGNHEYYGSSIGAEVDKVYRSYLPSNVHLLDNSEITLEGVHFYGGTMWFPDDKLNAFYEGMLNDFNLIGDIRSWVYQKNTEFREKGKALIKPDTIVLSHHLPSPQSTHRMYVNSPINRFFVSDETELILATKPRLWVHGHTHLTCDYELGSTRVVCDPYGYPNERKGMGRYPVAEFEI